MPDCEAVFPHCTCMLFLSVSQQRCLDSRCWSRCVRRRLSSQRRKMLAANVRLAAVRGGGKLFQDRGSSGQCLLLCHHALRVVDQVSVGGGCSCTSERVQIFSRVVDGQCKDIVPEQTIAHTRTAIDAAFDHEARILLYISVVFNLDSRFFPPTLNRFAAPWPRNRVTPRRSIVLFVRSASLARYAAADAFRSRD